MRTVGPIIIVEDDIDDQELLSETFKFLKYPHQVLYFTDGYKALDFIETTSVAPFLILSDINMPRINGFELREKLHSSTIPSVKSIPYLFFTTGAQKEAVEEASANSAQGFFIKPSSMGALQVTIRKILDYWQQCYLPNQDAAQSNGSMRTTKAA